MKRSYMEFLQLLFYFRVKWKLPCWQCPNFIWIIRIEEIYKESNWYTRIRNISYRETKYSSICYTKSISVEILIRCCRANAYISEILLSIVVISLLLHSHYNQLILRTITFLQKHGKHLLAFTLHLDK